MVKEGKTFAYLLQADGDGLSVIGLVLSDAPAKVHIGEEDAAIST